MRAFLRLVFVGGVIVVMAGPSGFGDWSVRAGGAPQRLQKAPPGSAILADAEATLVRAQTALHVNEDPATCLETLGGLGDRELTIYVPGSSHSSQVKKGIDAWREHTDLALTEVSKVGGADVVFLFTERLTYAGQEIAGYTNWRRAKGRLSATIQVRTSMPGGGKMNQAAIRHIAMHELGHVLGLADTSRVGDIMGPLDTHRTADRPTAPEIAHLKAFRARFEAVKSSALESLVARTAKVSSRL